MGRVRIWVIVATELRVGGPYGSRNVRQTKELRSDARDEPSPLSAFCWRIAGRLHRPHPSRASWRTHNRLWVDSPEAPSAVDTSLRVGSVFPLGPLCVEFVAA